MDFSFEPYQEQLRGDARRLFAERVTAERLAELADAPDARGRPGGVDLDLWAEVGRLGWAHISDRGGGDFIDEAVVLEEAGYALAPIPLVSTVIASSAVSAIGPLYESATVAWAEPDGAQAFGDHERMTSLAVPCEGGWLLTGNKCDVPDAQVADQLVLVTRQGQRDRASGALVPVPGTTPLVVVLDTTAVIRPELVMTVEPTVDGLRRVSRVAFAFTSQNAFHGERDLSVGLRHRAAACLALESVGIAQRALDMAAAHASTREQFGRAIGTYQAVSHRIADIYVQTQLARSLAYRAAWYVAMSETERKPELPFSPTELGAACSAAKAAAGEAAVQACEGLIQVLGGMGMTWEHVAHRFYKRALANRTYAGTPSQHRAVVAGALLDG